MTPTLRKRHLQIWLLLSLLLPLGFVLGIWAIPASVPPSQDIMTVSQPKDLLPTVDSRHAHGHGWDAQIKQDDQGAKYIEINVKQERKSPSSWVYLFDQDGEQRGPLLGMINHQGTYQFQVDSAQDLRGLMIYDQIKETILEQVNF